MTEQEALLILADDSVLDIDKIQASIEITSNLIENLKYAGYKLTYEKRGVTLQVNLLDPGKKFTVGSFCLSPFPACSSTIISHGAYVTNYYANKRFGTALHELRIRALSLAGFNRMLATVNTSNVYQESIMNKHDWKRISTFLGPHKDQVSLWERVL